MLGEIFAKQDEEPKKDGKMTFKDKQAKWDARSRVGGVRRVRHEPGI